MISPAEVLASTDWPSLDHAYGCAADLPDHLTLLLAEDPPAAERTLGGVLDTAVLHQGTICSATAPVARYVAAILADPRTGLPCGSGLPWDPRVRPLRAALLEWLANVAESAGYGEYDEKPDDPDQPEERELSAVDAVRALRAELHRAVEPFLASTTESVQAAALLAIGHLLRAPELTCARPAVAEQLLELGVDAGPAQRARIALTLDGWNIAPRALLADPDPAVRAYAAISPTLDDDPAALSEVRTALRDPASADEWFDNDVEIFPGLEGWFRGHLVAALLRRTTTFEEVEDEAAAIARSTHHRGGETALRPLVERAFPDPEQPGDTMTPAQRRFRALIDSIAATGPRVARHRR